MMDMQRFIIAFKIPEIAIESQSGKLHKAIVNKALDIS